MKKICVIADCVDDQSAGIYTYATELIRALEENKPDDMDITYIHYKDTDFFRDKKDLIIPMGRRFPGRSTLRKFFTLPRILRKKGFDLVHDLFHIAPFPKKDTQYKKVITIHDLTPILFPHFHVPQGHWIQKFVLPLVIHNAEEIITVSEHTKQDITRIYGRRDHVTAIPLAARKLSDTLSSPAQEDYILYVSTIEPRKNIETLLHAFEKLKEEGYRGALMLIGKKGWKCEYVFEMIEASPWKADIQWKGYVIKEELAGYYAKAKVFVYPSVYEGFGLPVLEAMQYGVPVVVGNNSSLREVVGDAGILFDAKNDMELSDILHQMLLLPGGSEMCDRYARASKDRAAQFSWKKTALATLEVYQKTIELD